MRVTLEYGRTGLEVELPDANVVKCLGYKQQDPLKDPDATLRRALAEPIGTPPLAELCQGKGSACIVISDITRPVPNQLLLTPMLEILEAGGIARDKITILVATGLHRPSTDAERLEMLGETIVHNYTIVDHYGRRDEEHIDLGVSPRGVPIKIDRRYIEADLKIATGLIEPHFMAGYSGGRKAICPGIAGAETIQVWHSPRFLEHENATTGRLEGNPVHEENTWIAKRAGCDFIANTVLNAEREVLHICAGDMEEAWHNGVDFARRLVLDTVPEPVDVVVTSSAGYPLDTTFYQSVKGMVGAASILKPGGTVILAASMSEGIGSPEFERLLREHATLEEFMDKIVNTDFFEIDQWQVEELNKVRRIGRILIVTDGLPAETLREFFVEPATSVESAIADCLELYGDDATIAVMPAGPYVIAEVMNEV
jgi:lactate racemase